MAGIYFPCSPLASVAQKPNRQDSVTSTRKLCLGHRSSQQDPLLLRSDFKGDVHRRTGCERQYVYHEDSKARETEGSGRGEGCLVQQATGIKVTKDYRTRNAYFVSVGFLLGILIRIL
jgi:hypothetical protein